MRVRITWWKPWVDRSTARPEKSAEGDIAGAVQDAAEWLKEGRPVVLEPLEEKQPEGHWAACSCPICTGIRDRRYP